MLTQIRHHKPLINGYSGFFPPGYAQFQLDMAQNFPSGFLVCFLGKILKVDTLIFDRSWYDAHQEPLSQYQELSRVVYQDEVVAILELLQTDRDCIPETIESPGL